MRRREFIVGLGSAATWPVPARPQQSALPVVGLLIGEALDGASPRLSAFRKGLGEIGYVEGQNVLIEYHSVEGQFDRIPAMVADYYRTCLTKVRAAESDRGRSLQVFPNSDAIAAESGNTEVSATDLSNQSLRKGQEHFELGYGDSVARMVPSFNLAETDDEELALRHPFAGLRAEGWQ